MTHRYGIAEWYGRPFLKLVPSKRQEFARIASRATSNKQGIPPCPFQKDRPPCSKHGGVCSLVKYEKAGKGRIAKAVGEAAIVCPKRFDEGNILVQWLAEIVELSEDEVVVAREVAFMQGTVTKRAAGKLDLVVAWKRQDGIQWYGLEIQAVYFSGRGMKTQFEALLRDRARKPPFPNEVRRPDWRSSSAKRLMPQLHVKAPTVRRWGSKLAIAVDRPFFEAIGGPSPQPAKELGDGDIIWMVPKLNRGKEGQYRLVRGHWEMLTLEQSSAKLLAAKTMAQADFEDALMDRLFLD